MSEPISGAMAVKSTVGALAALAATQTAVTVIDHVERSILGIPQSVLLAAIVGALIGCYLMPSKDAASLFEGREYTWRWYGRVVFKALMLGIGVLCFAFLDGWTIAALMMDERGKVGPAAMPYAGILGAFIRPLLPRYLKGLEGAADRLFGRIQ
ncbi:MULTISPECIES: hypothetical protein [unclassified Lysobacter]|uniref:hypothetical protein n=1 Tax=unclassified Lysobacter TaxID=2635362 RepID=UPI0007019ED3|nr:MULTISPECIES: hypothetical protein [unclassified Lysobacter]KRC35102.1 hypothetical protein ASE10_10560 [Lysobacter sp. Root76]KRD70790.1 hypothetical protein ASE45_02725 [Lysobacter sp. Root96]